MDNKSFFENPENHFDTEARLKALEGGAESHQQKIDEDDRMAVPSYGESVVIDYLKNRVKAGDDTTDPKGKNVFRAEFISQPEDDYEKEYKKLKSITQKELQDIIKKAEDKSKEGRGLFSKGPLLLGYVIDRITLESLESTTHDTVAVDLAYKISEDLIQKGDFENSDIDRIRYRRLVNGFIYLDIPGFSIPIVRLYLGMEEIGNKVPEADVQKIVEHIKRERKLLPISSDFKVL